MVRLVLASISMIGYFGSVALFKDWSVVKFPLFSLMNYENALDADKVNNIIEMK